MSKKVYIGVSGGVDSSVSAYLLKKNGYDPTGIYISIYQNDIYNCTNSVEKNHAMKVCAKLKIPFKIIEGTKIYDEYVKKIFIADYKNGLTPNPDVLCNEFVKFKILEDISKKENALIATGHYAKIKNINKRNLLSISKDKTKDQTYFLWSINKKILDRTIFPIGSYLKKEVRDIAKKIKLDVWDKPDSTGLCFLGNFKMHEFISSYLDNKKGDVVDESGEIIGDHLGVYGYTIGQRTGFKVNKNIPYYIKEIDFKKNVLITTSFKENIFVKSNEILLVKINQFLDNFDNNNLYARTRHQGPLLKIKLDNNRVIFENNILFAKGQSIVLYNENGDVVLGGVGS